MKVRMKKCRRKDKLRSKELKLDPMRKKLTDTISLIYLSGLGVNFVLKEKPNVHLTFVKLKVN